MKYKYVILDFDGTLADTAEGIYHTFTKVLTILGKQVPDDLSAHIGPPLEYSYRLLAGDDAEKPSPCTDRCLRRTRRTK